MKQKVSLFLIIIAALCVPLVVYAKWPDQEKIKTGVIGSWAFKKFWGVWQTPTEKGADSPADQYLIYTFYENGDATVWSMDKGKYNVENAKYHWGVVPITSTEGKQAFAVKLVDKSIDPKDQAAIEKASSDLTFVMTGVTKKTMWWIKTEPAGTFSDKAYFSEYQKADVIAPTY